MAVLSGHVQQQSRKETISVHTEEIKSNRIQSQSEKTAV